LWKDEHTLFIKGGQTYQAVDTSVEGDYSNAAFLSALSVLGGDVEVNGLRENSIQGDRVYTRFFDMLCKGTPTVHIGDCPDLGPILFAIAAAKYGGVFTGTSRLRIKESDRGAAMAEELKKFGTAVTVHDDTVVVYPAEFHAPSEILSGHGDHRIVMSLAVLCTLTGGTIEGAEAVAKSYPDFFEDIASLGIRRSASND
jgi:3-phosphoshikimate 1-carboxyvinyltransferase